MYIRSGALGTIFFCFHLYARDCYFHIQGDSLEMEPVSFGNYLILFLISYCEAVHNLSFVTLKSYLNYVCKFVIHSGLKLPGRMATLNDLLLPSNDYPRLRSFMTNSCPHILLRCKMKIRQLKLV